MQIPFTKMHGLGNDFVVVDTRQLSQVFNPDTARVRSWSDRKTGVGFDQLLCVDAGDDSHIASYRIFNADGHAVAQCGNGARCIAAYLYAEDALDPASSIVLRSPAGDVTAQRISDGAFSVSMGVPDFEPANIPLARATKADWYSFDVAGHQFQAASVSIGNPHCVLFVDDVETANVDAIGAALQHADDYPEAVNVGFCQITGTNSLRLRVFERGVGETQACGTGACAAAVCAIANGRAHSPITVRLQGGELVINWLSHQHAVQMRGPTAVSFRGYLNL